ncbi:hypothetical protein D0Z07_4306 [Hyphodiscus hymeniophilus]|uniref:Uncharacterized protein n=1 Tax=Hyphodiscus hymeniophilus TaxID=353542 RepID=A0A9P7AXS4_9HELO|nr:hypothetical protein D0Z07_4306 [Hyphodiscus hymeniophilus]
MLLNESTQKHAVAHDAYWPGVPQAVLIYWKLENQNAREDTVDNDGPPTVNELITTLRRSHVSPKDVTTALTVVTPTLPPQIRQLLSQPETPSPRPRDRRQRFDATGRRLPPGPAPPRSWVEGSRHGKTKATNKERLYPHDINALPGMSNGMSRKLQDMCLRTMAREWEFIRIYESNNLAELPTGLRMLLLSHVAVYGPEEGVGAEGLNVLLHPTTEEGYKANNNDGFFRVDLSGWTGSDPATPEGIEWNAQWMKMKTLVVRCGFFLHEDSEYWEVERFTRDFRRMFMLQKYIARVRKGRWIEVVRDNWEAYDGFWKDGTEEGRRKQNQIDTFKVNWWTDEFEKIVGEAPMIQDVERRSVWEQ